MLEDKFLTKIEEQKKTLKSIAISIVYWGL